nr:hypothetical protein CFP56_50551 [Quercus suber]
MEAKISELKKTASNHSSSSILIESEELSSSQRFQDLMEVTVKLNLIKNLKRQHSAISIFENNNQKLEVSRPPRVPKPPPMPSSSSSSNGSCGLMTEQANIPLPSLSPPLPKKVAPPLPPPPSPKGMKMGATKLIVMAHAAVKALLALGKKEIEKADVERNSKRKR